MWERTFVLNKTNFFGTTFIANDGYGCFASIDTRDKKGTIPPADKNLFFVLGIPLGVECSWEIIPETERSMPKIYLKKINSEEIE